MIDPDDRKGQTCTECGIGYYDETSIHDDWDGVLHCTNKECNYEVRRYKYDDNPQPKPEKAQLSPAAQAVLDAAINVAESPDAEAIAAAVLRAAVHWLAYETQLDDPMMTTTHVVDADRLDAIADELEAQ
jgi:hypothetical protein